MYYFSERNARGNHAGTKARNDVETILKRMGAVPVNKTQMILKEDEEKGISSNFNHRLQVIKLFYELRRFKNEFVFVQYPMLAFDQSVAYLSEISARNKLVLIVHDLHGLRLNNHDLLQNEIAQLNKAYALIVHNERMQDKLRELGVNQPHMILLGLFDYLFEGSTAQRAEDDSIVFAGNLAKSGFIREALYRNPDVNFQLFGNGWNSELDRELNASYRGSFPPDILPSKITGTYGLVWDSCSLEGGEGPLGLYEAINNPHKFSLYLAVGIPVIVWKGAAAASVVERYHIGLTLDSLENLKQPLCGVTDEKYMTMCRNISPVRDKVRTGYYMEKAIRNAMMAGE